MTFKIERTHGGEVTRVRLIGRFESECLEELQEQVGPGRPQVVLDLADLELVDVEMVRFLNACQCQGVGIANVAPYIREWMLREQMAEE